MWTELFHVVAPVFGIALLGWIFASIREIDLEALTTVILYLSAPALVFSALAKRPLDAGQMAAVGGGVVAQIVVCGVIAWAVLRAAGIRGRGVSLAAMFPNTGNLGLPLALFAFGQEGLSAAVIVFATVTLVQYSVGVVIVSGSLRLTEALRMPLFWAAVAGVIAALTTWQPPAPVLDGLDLLGQAAVPLMLISLGYRMRSVRLHRPALPIAAVILRFVPGLATAVVWTWLLGMEGPARGVVLVTGVLPSAVMNFVLAEAYDEQGEEVAGAILIGTAASIAAVPLVLHVLA